MNASTRFNPIPSFIGSFVGIAIGAVLGTAFFNLMVFLLAGINVSQETAYVAVQQNSYFLFGGLVIAFLANGAAGAVAVKLHKTRPYLTALATGTLIVLWSTIFLVTPIQQSQIDIFTILGAFVLPIPCSVFGAYLLSRVPRSG